MMTRAPGLTERMVGLNSGYVDDAVYVNGREVIKATSPQRQGIVAGSGGATSDFSSILSRLQAQQQSAMQGYMSRLNSNLGAQQRLQERANNQRAQAYGRVEREQQKQELDSRRTLMRTNAQVRDEQEDNALMLQRGLLQNAQRRSYQSGLLTNFSKGTTNLSNRMS